MNMKRIEAPTLEEAYRNAAKAFGCSVTEINYEIVQHPATGMMGLFKKTAIIVAVKKVPMVDDSSKIVEESIVTEVPKVEKAQEKPIEKKVEVEVKEESRTIERLKASSASDVIEKKLVQEDDKILDGFFDSVKESKEKEIKKENHPYRFDDDRDDPKNLALALQIENKLLNLMKISCFDIDTVEVDVFNRTAHIFIDGEDAALLIGKEGYRYNALSYMLFNWINAKHNLYIKLEIAEFIQAQEEMIVNYLKPIIEYITEKGRGKTKPLDGILVQIALEQLRAEFPNKYVAIKTGRDGKKFIIINNFNSKKNV